MRIIKCKHGSSNGHGGNGSMSLFATLNISKKYSKMVLSVAACKLLGLCIGDHVSIIYDETENALYIRRAEDPDDGRDTQTAKCSKLYGHDTSCIIRCKEVIGIIMDNVGSYESVTVMLSKKKTRIGWKGYHKILTDTIIYRK